MLCFNWQELQFDPYRRGLASNLKQMDHQVIQSILRHRHDVDHPAVLHQTMPSASHDSNEGICLKSGMYDGAAGQASGNRVNNGADDRT